MDDDGSAPAPARTSSPLAKSTLAVAVPSDKGSSKPGDRKNSGSTPVGEDDDTDDARSEAASESILPMPRMPRRISKFATKIVTADGRRSLGRSCRNYPSLSLIHI